MSETSQLTPRELFRVDGLHVRPAGEPGAAPADEILRGLDLLVSDGEVHAIMGPNGSGKSTLGNTLLGSPEYEVTAGTITFRGDDVTALARRRACQGRHVPRLPVSRRRSPASR